MRKIFYFIAAMAIGHEAFAAPNDTTIVVAHNATKLSWYQAYDSTVQFPDGNTSYRKIFMEFNVGKYQCDNYDPTNPGEGAGQTGWCADWDYDVHALAMTAAGDTFELGRLISPYANSTFINTPANWNQSYYFDVTDYYSILKDSVTVRIFYAGYSGGFTGTIKFHMIEGERERDVLAIKPLWNGSYEYGNANNPINDAIAADSIDVPVGTDAAAMKFIITGHGNQEQGCAEFCRKYYSPVINGTFDPVTYIWRDDCGANFLYPQSGTWIYNRANWCPGDLVQTNIHAIPASVLATGKFQYDVNFQSYSSNRNGGFPIYKVASALFFYSERKHTTDAGLVVIKSPTTDKYYNRENPVFKESKIRVKNHGSAIITTIDFKYGVNGNLTNNYTWNGQIAAGEEMDVLIPLNNLLNQSGNLNTFNVQIDKVNGVTDDETHNNTLSSEFESVPQWNGGKYSVEFTPPGSFNNNRQQVKYTIYDKNDNVVITKSQNVPGTKYTDEVSLPNGFYKLEVSLNAGAGLSFFNYFSRGDFRVFDISAGRTRIAIPRNDLGNGGLEGNVGSGFTQNFQVVNSILSVAESAFENSCLIYPNPASKTVNLEWANTSKSATVLVYNTLGQVVYQNEVAHSKHTINVDQWSAGVYQVMLVVSGQSVIRKIIVE